MITEREIAEKFGVIWKQNFPLLNSNFMRILNAQTTIINENEIEHYDDVRHDLTSELAFNLAKVCISNDTALDSLLNSKEMETMIAQTASKIWGNLAQSGDLRLTVNEVGDVRGLSKNILHFVDQLKIVQFEFCPVFPGYSVFPEMEGDLSIDDTLYELKTVNRSFRSTDLKQLIIYIALKQVSGNQYWKYAGLYNPRRGIYYRFNIQRLLYNLSGGRSSFEACSNLLESLSREVQIDSKF